MLYLATLTGTRGQDDNPVLTIPEGQDAITSVAFFYF
jgi:hypothetical protein